MPLKNNELDKFLSKKLRFDRDDKRHIKYVLPKQLGGLIPGVLPIQLQHGRGDVSDHIVRQISGFLGLNQRRFGSAQDCDYSQRVIYYSMLVSQMERLMKQAEGEPVVFSRNLPVFCQCIPMFLANVDSLFDSALHKRDGELLSELHSRLLDLKGDRVIARHSDRVAMLATIDGFRKRIEPLFS